MSLFISVKTIVSSIRNSRRTMLKTVASRMQGIKQSAASSADPDANPDANADAALNTNSSPADMANMDEIVEGSARILHPKGAVFYNPAQVVNRDLSVLVLRHHTKTQTTPQRILEALSATGLRSIRYFNEVPNVSCVIANDFDKSAVATINRTVRHNRLNPDTQVIPNHGDAAAVMATAAALPDPSPYHIIDLDPYGSAAPFIEPALRAITDGGLLAVTCTDLAVLCGNSPETCYMRYGATPLKGACMHEMAVRIVMSSIQAAASRLGRAVEPVLCAKIDFYVRLFVRVRNSKSLAQHTPSMTSLVFQCAECGTQRFQPMGRIRSYPASNTPRLKRRRREADSVEKSTEGNKPVDASAKPSEKDGENGAGDAEERRMLLKYQPPVVQEHISDKCSICGGAMQVGGPFWSGPLTEEGVVKDLIKSLGEEHKLFKARDRVEALITLLGEEVRTVPLFMNIPNMCKVLRTCAPPAASVRSVLLKKGYEVSQSHTDPAALKTTAPPELVWDILKLWAHENGSPLLKKLETMKKEETPLDGESKRRLSTGERILQQEVKLIKPDEVDFSVKKDKFMRRGTAQNQNARFPQNPEPYWGPKARAGKRQRAQED